jgi:hypothetical protein
MAAMKHHLPVASLRGSWPLFTEFWLDSFSVFCFYIKTVNILQRLARPVRYFKFELLNF